MQGNARILSMTRDGLRVCASAGRISTTGGMAVDVFEKATDEKKNLSLVKKVLSSGHESILEHLNLNIAFTDASVLVEEYMIEHRLASFFVKSRRYVDFSDSGFYAPQGADERYLAPMKRRFEDYNTLLALGIPKEDARFVLPYCFYSNFYVTANAREFAYIIADMLNGRGSASEEIRMLGESLRAQFDEYFPGIIAYAVDKKRNYKKPKFVLDVKDPNPKSTDVELLSRPVDAKLLLDACIKATGRFDEGAYRDVIRDARPRELEQLNYSFLMKNVSLACVTHFARHRMYSPAFPDVASALSSGGYVMPDTIRKNESALAVYSAAFSDQAQAARIYKEAFPEDDAISYFALSGNTVDFIMTINARELALFSKLRICRRAQWEIQEFAVKMLKILRGDFYELFSLYGPSCLIDGACPEGRLSCGLPFTEDDLLK